MTGTHVFLVCWLVLAAVNVGLLVDLDHVEAALARSIAVNVRLFVALNHADAVLARSTAVMLDQQAAIQRLQARPALTLRMVEGRVCAP
jgi:hypothetical protein